MPKVTLHPMHSNEKNPYLSNPDLKAGFKAVREAIDEINGSGNANLQAKVDALGKKTKDLFASSKGDIHVLEAIEKIANEGLFKKAYAGFLSRKLIEGLLPLTDETRAGEIRGRFTTIFSYHPDHHHDHRPPVSPTSA